jgi:hypothetical protein
MMRRLDESELAREPARTLGEAHGLPQRAAVLAHVLRVLTSELSSEQLLSLRAQLEHAIERGLRGAP